MAKRVVVVGGGFAGSLIAKQLLKHSDLIDLTLIDTKDYFEHTPGVFREIISYAANDGYYSGNWEEVLPAPIVEHSSYLFPKGKLIVGEVLDVSVVDVTVNVWERDGVDGDIGNEVEQRKLKYDFLVICTGNSYPGFIKSSARTVAERHREYHTQGNALRNAENVLVIGAGPAGVELTAEILQQYPNKQVALIGPALLEKMNPKAQNMAHQYLEYSGARLMIGHAVTTLQIPDQKPYALLDNGKISNSIVPLQFQNLEKGSIKYTTTDGQVNIADKIYYCCGAVPRTNFMLKNFFQTLDDNFRLQVNEFLQLESYPKIFAAGDVTNIKEEKLAERALKHAEVVIENILSVAKGLMPKVKYIPQDKIGLQVVSLGAATGALTMWGEVVSSGKVAASAKDAFLSHHCFSLLSSSSLSPSGFSLNGLVVNSPAIISKVAHCTSRVAVLGQATRSTGGLSMEVVKYLAKHGTLSVVIVPTGSVIKKKGVQVMEWESNDMLCDTLQDVDTVLLTCTIGPSMVSECTTFIQACKEAQVKCIVKCTQGAVDAELCHHQLAEWNHQIEELLKNSGIPYHFLS